ncbi:MAG: exodeoxyribonuclease III [Patescibacteria group bacterium]
MKITSWNINGIRAITKKGFYDFLKKEKADIICLQEIKIDNDKKIQEKFDFKNYKEFWNSAIRPGYAGTLFLVKEKSVIYKQIIKHTTGINNEIFDNEGRVQTLEFKNFFLINAYFPNSRDDLSRLKFKQEFDKKILLYLKKLSKKKPIILVGDLNIAHQEIDLARPKENEKTNGFTYEERQDFSFFVKNNFIDTFRHFNPQTIKYSWWSFRARARERNVGWRLDYVLCDKKLLKKIKKTFIQNEIYGSDHCPVGIEIDL